MKTRLEKDSIGALHVPAEALYGIFTVRAYHNFQISRTTAHPVFTKALAMVKKAAAIANHKEGILEQKLMKAIAKAADSVIAGHHNDQFFIDSFNAGAATPFNMNMNEVLANLANKSLGKKLGSYSPVHPNDHVNMSQSTNSEIPTALRLAALMLLDAMLPEMAELAKTFIAKAREYNSVLKPGRTHFQDAVPITYGQVFMGYATNISKHVYELNHAKQKLLHINLGGTAIGTGINTTPKLRKRMVNELSKIAGYDFRLPLNNVEITWSASDFSHVSLLLKNFCLDMQKILDDLIILSSGPKTGVAELILPEVEPGSSIMPGKVNPSIVECTAMVCCQVMGNDAAISFATERGKLELNVLTPVIIKNLPESLELLKNALYALRTKCVLGLKVNRQRCHDLIERSLIFATALNPYLGYEVVAELVKDSLRKNITIRAAVLSRELMTEQELNLILDPQMITKPHKIDVKLARKMKSSQQYLDYKKMIEK